MVGGIGPADGGDGGDGGGGLAVIHSSTVWRPIGISPALIRPPGQDWWQGNKWPPADWDDDTLTPPNKGWPNHPATRFPRRAWSANNFGLAMLGEFAETGATTTPTWNAITLPGYPAGSALDDEIDELVQLIDYRPGVMSEALMQRDDLLKYWCGVLMFGASSHPYTFDLMEIAFRIGQFQVMHYKR